MASRWGAIDVEDPLDGFSGMREQDENALRNNTTWASNTALGVNALRLLS